MDYTAYFEMLSNDGTNPCYFADMDTYQMLYANKAMVKLLKDYEAFIGRPCYEVIHGIYEPCSFCPNQEITSDQFLEKDVYNGVTQSYFHCCSTQLRVENSNINMSKYLPDPAKTSPEKGNLSLDEAMTRCGNILSQQDSEEMRAEFLSLLGEFYQAEKAYIFEVKDTVLKNSYYWLENNTIKTLKQLNNPLVLDYLLQWISDNGENQVLELNREKYHYAQGTMEVEILSLYPMKNMLIHPLYKEGVGLYGFVGVSNRRSDQADFRLLTAVTRFVQESFCVHTMQQELSKLNEIDQLTSCYNRSRYGAYLRFLQGQLPEKMGVLFVNLNGLRKTNEFFGYEVGDIQILKTLAHLRQHFTEDFYRISGDEFIAFFPESEEITFHNRVESLQTELHDSNNNSYSVGSAWNEGDYDILKLVAAADTVMYINKQEYYYNSMQENPEVRESILQDLLYAVKTQEFLVYLQPKVELSTGRVTGAEALVRRFDKEQNKMTYPNSFIPLYEKNSIIRHIDLYVLEKVCVILKSWKKTEKMVPISVNLSRVTLSEFGIVATVTNICDKYQIPRDMIMLEVTERVGMLENDVASSLVEEFHDQGFKISLDDFGCAYSNIVTLAQISVDEVKLDKSLVDDLTNNPKNKIILENMINMCNALENTSTLAEGIEQVGQAERLMAIQCNYGQGYLYSKPIPHEEFFRLYIQGEERINTNLPHIED